LKQLNILNKDEDNIWMANQILGFIRENSFLDLWEENIQTIFLLMKTKNEILWISEGGKEDAYFNEKQVLYSVEDTKWYIVLALWQNQKEKLLTVPLEQIKTIIGEVSKIR
jgi:hypothetical protein